MLSFLQVRTSAFQYFSLFSILSVLPGLIYLRKDTVKEAWLPVEYFMRILTQNIETDNA